MNNSTIDLATRLARYERFHAVQEPALLVNIRCHDQAHNLFQIHDLIRHFWRLDIRQDEHRLRIYQGWVDEVIEENKLHPLDDDYIPAIKLLLTPYLYSLIIKDRLIKSTEHSAWAEHCLTSIDQVSELSCILDDNNFWWRFYRDGYQFAIDAANGRIPIQPPQHNGLLDLAWDLRGNDLYMDVVSEPERLPALLDFISAAIDAINGGLPDYSANQSLSGWAAYGWGYNVFAPGAGLITTIDSSNQISPDTFREAERPWLERLTTHRSGTVLHMHSGGLHQLPNVVDLPGIAFLQLVSDVNKPVMAKLDDVLDVVGLKPLIVSASPAEIRQHIGTLSKGRIVLRAEVASRGEGEELLRFVRDHSRGYRSR
ncbi:MAG: hypothetical protein WCO98_00685 [bacterium]